ncbi:MAG: CehA/McbA family metallohydrolase, partial [Rhodothermales bacterium]
RRSPREDPLLHVWTSAEDIRVGNMLRMGDFWATYYAQYAFGADGVYEQDGYLLLSGQEDPRTPELGHVIGLGASEFIRFPNRYYLYDLVFDGLRASGGLGGYAHQAETFHGYRGLTLDGLREKVDLVEIVQFCAPGGPLITEHYYHLLDLGFPLTATAGSDFPWCGKPHDGSAEIPVHEQARIGNARFYAYLGDDGLTYANWMDAVRAGRTFATSGPVLLLEVDGRKPGAAIDLPESGPVTIEATARGHAAGIPLASIEIVAHGTVIASASADDPDQSTERLRIRTSLEVEEGVWIAARATAGSMQVAHTTPVYVTVDGGGFHNRAALNRLLDRSETYLADVDSVSSEPHHGVGEHAWRYRDGLMERVEAAREVLDHLREAH